MAKTMPQDCMGISCWKVKPEDLMWPTKPIKLPDGRVLRIKSWTPRLEAGDVLRVQIDAIVGRGEEPDACTAEI